LLGSDSTGAALAQLGAGFTVNSILLKYSRADESQADIMGTQILYDSGYDPRAMAQFFEKIQAENKGGNPVEFFSDHPNPDHRIERVDQEIDQLGGPPRVAKTDSKEFQEIKRYVLSRPAPPGKGSKLAFFEIFLDDLFCASLAFQCCKFGEIVTTEQRRHAVTPAVTRSDDGTICFEMSRNKPSNDLACDERLVTQHQDDRGGSGVRRNNGFDADTHGRADAGFPLLILRFPQVESAQSFPRRRRVRARHHDHGPASCLKCDGRGASKQCLAAELKQLLRRAHPRRGTCCQNDCADACQIKRSLRTSAKKCSSPYIDPDRPTIQSAHLNHGFLQSSGK